MAEITVTTQAELDALPASFQEFTYVYIKSSKDTRLTINKARENSHVVAWENSHVVARDNSHVEAWENVCIWNHSSSAEVILFAFAVCFALFTGAKTKIIRKSRFSKIISPRKSKSLAEWSEINGVELKSKVVVYKRVSVDFKTQERTHNETVWTIGETVTHRAWNPKISECGQGKFHACPKPFFCDEFRSDTGDRYIAIEVAKRDLFSWPNPEYQHKIAFRKGTVLYECDRFGNRIG
jgi:hypothetical protein